METLKQILTEEQSERVAQKVLKNLTDDIKDKLANEFYTQMNNYLYEHYENFKNGIHAELLAEITEQYVKDPSSYKFKDLRDKLFSENKETVVNSLTDHAIHKSVEKILLGYTHQNHLFSWQWKEGVAKFILDHWHELKDDERINSVHLRQIENLKSQVGYLQEKLSKFTEY